MNCPAEIVCFADAGHSVGSGHIFRVRPVWEAVREKGISVQMFSPLSKSKIHEMKLTAVISENSKQFSKRLRKQTPRVLLLDTYRGRNEILRSVSLKNVVLFDDHYVAPKSFGLIVNASPVATPMKYGKYGALLLGPRYASLHRAFRLVRPSFRVRNAIRSIVVALGGNDTAENLSSMVSSLLQVFPQIKLKVCGAPGRKLARHPNIERFPWVNQQTLASLMAASDLAVLAGGQMLVQSACVGLPVISLPQTQNQIAHASAWEKIGSILMLRERRSFKKLASSLCSKDLRAEMSRAGRAAVDGRGADRIAKALLHLVNGSH